VGLGKLFHHPGRIVFPGNDDFHFPDDVGHFLLEEVDQNIVLVMKIEINRPVGHLGFPGNIRNLGLIEPVPGKDPNRGLQDFFRLLVSSWASATGNR
jgi:hypothetical protein